MTCVDNNSFDIAVIGAGPAGMSAAITAAKKGARVIVLDDKVRAGGQIYRNVAASPLVDKAKLGPDYVKGEQLVKRFNACGCETRFGASVWHIGDNGEILFSYQGATQSLTAREIIVCCGAMERPFPVPGWHMPGVMTAGSAQVMLKNDGLVKEDAVFVGSGPLLYLIVAQYIRFGVKVKALVDTTPRAAYLEALPLLPAALSQFGVLKKGLLLLNEIRQAGVPVFSSATQVQVRGEKRAQGVSFVAKGKTHKLESEHVFLHQGVIPNLNITRAIGLQHHYSEQQLNWQPMLDQWGASSVSNIAVAGDCSAIIGADAAEEMGQVVALDRLNRLGLITAQQRDEEAQKPLAKVKSYNQLRRFIDRLYLPIEQHRVPQNAETMVCRCEEQTQGQLRAGYEQGACTPDELKGLTRCGMGPCQGRQCGHTVTELLAQWQEKSVSDVGYYRLRSPLRLLSLPELSQFQRISPAAKSEEVTK